MSKIIWLEETSSTNDDAKELTNNNSGESFWVGATCQNSGRGRGDRVWESPKGNLYASWVGPMQCSLAEASQLSFVASLSVADAVASFLPKTDLTFKWPNDVLSDGKKFCGILLESKYVNTSPKTLWLIIGIGVNLITPPKEAIFPATALGLNVKPKLFLENLATAFERLKKVWEEEGFKKIRSSWLDKAQGLGKNIKVRLPSAELSGVFNGLTPKGALVLKTDEGLEEIEAGDVFFNHG